MRKIGLIAGGGGLGLTLARHCLAVGRPLFVIRLKGFAPSELDGFEGEDVGLAELGKGFRALRSAGCQAVCFAGKIDRPDMRRLRPDRRGLAALPGALMAARRGDDALLSFLIGEFEKEGFVIEGPQQVMDELVLSLGPQGRHAPSAENLADVLRALEVARAIGRLDVGQGAVCCDGLILAVEAQEGTDAMLRRVASLPSTIRGAPGSPRGALAKACKPGQELRIDLPTIGPATIQSAANAGLAGVAGEEGHALIVDRQATGALADALGLFIFGVSAEKR